MKNEVNKENTAYLVSTADNTKIKEPALYRIVVHNDDFTPMEFVVETLMQFFLMDRRKAIAAMYEAHLKGSVAAGIYSQDVAETKVAQVIAYARKNEHPLICSMEAAP